MPFSRDRLTVGIGRGIIGETESAQAARRAKEVAVMLKFLWYLCTWPFYLFVWICKVVGKIAGFLFGVWVIDELFGKD